MRHGNDVSLTRFSLSRWGQASFKVFLIQGVTRTHCSGRNVPWGKPRDRSPALHSAFGTGSTRPAPSSCDYPKHWSILHLHSDVRNLIWQDFLPASPFWKGFLLLPSSSRANTCLLLRCSELCLRHSMAQGRSSAALTWSGWNKGGLVTSHPTISPNFIKTDPL